MSVSSDWYNLDQDNTLGGDNPSILKIPSQKAIKEALDTKQDVLTASTGITITQSQDTRSTASIVTVGSNRWQGVAYGNGVFVAVGNDGYVAYSSDGVTWSTPTRVGTNSWYSITFANGKFVAVGNNGYTTTSTDGVTWTTPTQISGLSNRLMSVRYGNGVFCAVGWDTKSTTSTDGINWTTPVAIGSGFAQINTILFDGEKFVCFSRDNEYNATSTDGVTWTTNTMNNNMTKHSSTFGNSVYVVGSEVSGQVMYSSNLTTWSTPIDILDRVESIYYDGTQFIAVGRRQMTSSTYKYSTVTSSDGITWDEPVDIGEAAGNLFITYGFLSITYGNGKYVAVGDSGATTTFEIKYNTLISINVDDALSSSSENPVQNKVINSALSDKQDTLISGTTLKTINNTSLLGSGNIDIQGGGGTPTDVQINGTSITSNNVANILTNTAYDSSTNKIATMSDVPDTSNFVTTNTNQNITGTKTFVGTKKVAFKQSGTNDKLGFTLYDSSNNEKGYLEFNPSNTVDSAPLMTLGNYATSSSNITQVGFRRYSSVSGANGAYNLLTPLIADAKSPFSLTTTYTNFYMPLGFKNGSTQVTTAKSGVADLSTLFPTIATSVSSSSTNAETVGAKLFYDTVGNIESALNTINSGSNS